MLAASNTVSIGQAPSRGWIRTFRETRSGCSDLGRFGDQLWGHSADPRHRPRFRRFRRRFGTRCEGKAIFAVAHTLVVIAWRILASDGLTYRELGPDWFDRRDTEAHVRRLVHQLERLGLRVNLEPAA